MRGFGTGTVTESVEAEAHLLDTSSRIWTADAAPGGLFAVRRRFFAGAGLEIGGLKTFGTERERA